MTSHAIEGLDISCLNLLILQEGKGEVSLVQRCGRVVRPSDLPSVVINFYDRNAGAFTKHAFSRFKLMRENYMSPYSDVNNISQMKIVTESIIDSHK